MIQNLTRKLQSLSDLVGRKCVRPRMFSRRRHFGVVTRHYLQIGLVFGCGWENFVMQRELGQKSQFRRYLVRRIFVRHRILSHDRISIVDASLHKYLDDFLFHALGFPCLTNRDQEIVKVE